MKTKATDQNRRKTASQRFSVLLNTLGTAPFTIVGSSNWGKRRIIRTRVRTSITNPSALFNQLTNGGALTHP